MLRRLRVLVPATAAVFAVTAVVAVAGGTVPGVSEQTPARDATPNGAGPGTERLFGVFRTQRQPADSLPPPPAGTQTGTFGIDRSESRQIHTTATVSRAWALPAGNDFSCIAYLPPKAAGPGFGCSPSEGDPNILYVEVGSGEYDVFGLVRDGYEQAEIAFNDGSRQTVPVEQNAFSAHSSATPREVTLSGSIDTAHVDLDR
jgi:hypothetical protein